MESNKEFDNGSLTDKEFEALTSVLWQLKTYYDASFNEIVDFLRSRGLSRDQMIECIRRIVTEYSGPNPKEIFYNEDALSRKNSYHPVTPQSGFDNATEKKQADTIELLKGISISSGRFNLLPLDVSEIIININRKLEGIDAHLNQINRDLEEVTRMTQKNMRDINGFIDRIVESTQVEVTRGSN